jgi:hypothetical protein
MRFRFGSATQQADEHSTPVQRLYNLMCLAYGSDPQGFGAIATSGALPKERADGCEYEYHQIVWAWTKLLQPHIDPEVARRVNPLGLLSPR